MDLLETSIKQKVFIDELSIEHVFPLNSMTMTRMYRLEKIFSIRRSNIQADMKMISLFFFSLFITHRLSFIMVTFCFSPRTNTHTRRQKKKEKKGEDNTNLLNFLFRLIL